MRDALGLVTHLVAFARRIAGVTNVAVIRRRVIHTAVALVIRHVQPEVRITGVIRFLYRIMMQVRPRIDRIEESKSTLERPGRFVELVAQCVRIELLDLEVSD